MFNRDGIFGKKEDSLHKEPRSNVNLTPGLHNSSASRVNPPESIKSEPQQAPEPVKIPVAVEEASGSQLIVGPHIKLKGVEITDCDTLVVEGRVEASMDSRVVKIAEQGVFSGTVGIDVAEIRGRFEGELTARKHLIVHSTGKVSGKIRYGKITVEEGGEITGDIATLAPGAATQAAKGSSAASTSAADIMTAYDPFAHKSKAPAGKASTAA